MTYSCCFFFIIKPPSNRDHQGSVPITELQKIWCMLHSWMQVFNLLVTKIKPYYSSAGKHGSSMNAGSVIIDWCLEGDACFSTDWI